MLNPSELDSDEIDILYGPLSRSQLDSIITDLTSMDNIKRVYTIQNLTDISHGMAVEKGWWEGWDGVLSTDEVRSKFIEKLALMHSELSEVLEEVRNGRDYTEVYTNGNGKPEGIPIEFADLFIRVFDTCGAFGIDLEDAILRKIEYNATRPHRHGGKKA